MARSWDYGFDETEAITLALMRDYAQPPRGGGGGLGGALTNFFGNVPAPTSTVAGTLRELDPNKIDDVQDLVNARSGYDDTFTRMLERDAPFKAPQAPPRTGLPAPWTPPPGEFGDLIGDKTFGGGSAVDDFIPSSPAPSPSPSPAGAGGGGGGALSVFRGVLSNPYVRGGGRVLGRVANVLGPFADQFTLWDEYMHGAKRRNDAEQARRRSTGPKRRTARRTPARSAPASVFRDPLLEQPQIRVKAPGRVRVDESQAGNIWGAPVPNAFPDPYRDMSRRVATRGVGTGVTKNPYKEPELRMPGTIRAPRPGTIEIEQPWWRRLWDAGREFVSTLDPQEIATELFERSQPRTDFESPATQPPRETAPGPSSRTSPEALTSAGPSQARCSSNDPCMRRAADKRREQRRKAKQCTNRVKVNREVTVCQPSK